MSDPADFDAITRKLADTCGFIFDIDGVFHVGMQPVPGGDELLASLQAHGIPYRMLTNSTVATRATLAARLQSIGLPVSEELIMTASLATAGYVARRFPGQPCYLLATGDAADEFRAAGIPLVDVDAEPEAAVVVIGGAEHELTYARLNHVYRLLLKGAKLIAMHRNTAWRTANGMQLDSGPFVRALEQAAGVRATVIGKPSLPIFRQAISALGLPAAHLVMVGDDAYSDLRPARRLGLMTVLVRTGKPVGPAEETMADVVVDRVGILRRALPWVSVEPNNWAYVGLDHTDET
jgi:HAD superfamily hydrolase (TIGR01458 family)